MVYQKLIMRQINGQAAFVTIDAVNNVDSMWPLIITIVILEDVSCISESNQIYFYASFIRL
jgi:hypothetical protein